jgi:hypothetical protein
VMQVEYGPMELDLALRVRVHLLTEALEKAKVSSPPSPPSPCCLSSSHHL